jgi:hypothetical protein
MASTYSDLKIELIGTGEQSGTWGVTTDVNLGTALSEAITGSADVAYTSAADVTVTLTDTNTAQTARNLRLNITESGAGIGYVGNLILGSGCQIEKFYIINNGSTGAKTVKNTTGTGISVPAGKSMVLFNNGTNVVEAVTYVASLTTPSATITGGTVNGTPIGGTTPAAGAFTTLSASGASTFGADSTYNGTGQVKLPVGTTGQRSGSPVDGMIRGNSTDTQFEGYIGGKWGSIGGAQAGGAVYENKQSITANYTMSTNYNGESVGPITIASGVTVQIPSNSRWVIL